MIWSVIMLVPKKAFVVNVIKSLHMKKKEKLRKWVFIKENNYRSAKVKTVPPPYYQGGLENQSLTKIGGVNVSIEKKILFSMEELLLIERAIYLMKESCNLSEEQQKYIDKLLKKIIGEYINLSRLTESMKEVGTNAH